MRGHTHILFAVALGSLYFNHFSTGDWISKAGFALALIFGALLPDIDEKESTMSKQHPFWNRIANSLSAHRGLFHTIWIPIIIFLVAYFVVSKYFAIPALMLMGFFIGYGSHLIADSMTVQGTTPLHPVHRGRINGFIKTGGILETIFMCALVVFLMFY